MVAPFPPSPVLAAPPSQHGPEGGVLPCREAPSWAEALLVMPMLRAPLQVENLPFSSSNCMPRAAAFPQGCSTLTLPAPLGLPVPLGSDSWRGVTSPGSPQQSHEASEGPRLSELASLLEETPGAALVGLQGMSFLTAACMEAEQFHELCR